MTRIGLVRRAILSRRLAGWRGFMPALLIWGGAIGLRIALDPLVAGVPFLTFFPAVLLASVLLGWRWGAAVLLGSAFVANYAFQPPFMAAALGQKELVSSAAFLLSGALMITVAAALRRAMGEIADAAMREAELNLELNHRVNNNLAVVQALAGQTLRSQPQPEAFAEAFTARLQALGQANKVLSGASWEKSPVQDLVDAALRPFADSGQIGSTGPAVTVPAISCVPLVLVLHELATNAVKHGALSTPSGRVDLTWSLEETICRLTWREAGGPPVRPPTRRGMGTRLLRPQSGINRVDLAFDPAGVVAELRIEGARST